MIFLFEFLYFLLGSKRTKLSKQQILYNRLYETLKCYECNRTLQGDIAVCMKGHGICGSCRRSSSCSCSNSYSTTTHHILRCLIDLLNQSSDGISITTLENALECPVCYSHLRKPMNVCIYGHGVCTDCRSQLEFCPLCREVFLPYYNQLLNSAIQAVDLPTECINKEFGCTHNELSSSIHEHERVCEFRQFACPEIPCYWNGTSENLVHHFLDVHQPNENEAVPSGSQISQIRLIIHRGRFFWFKSTFLKDLGIRVCVQAVDFKGTIDFKTCEIELHCGDLEMSFEACINEAGDNFSNENGILIPNRILRAVNKKNLELKLRFDDEKGLLGRSAVSVMIVFFYFGLLIWRRRSECFLY